MLKNDFLHLVIPLPENPQLRVWWYRYTQWNSTQLDLLTAPGNCSVQPLLGPRVGNCSSIFTLLRTDYQDAGLYLALATYNDSVPSNSSFLFNVSVFETRPVLSIVGMKKVEVGLQCVDLMNPHAQLELEIKQFRHFSNHLPIITPYSNHPGFYVLKIPGLYKDQLPSRYQAFFFEGEGRCCSKYHNYTVCGPYSRLSHNMYLDTASARGRPWCYSRGNVSHHRGVNFHIFHPGLLPNPKCYQTHFLSSSPHLLVCENQETTVVYTTNDPVQFRVAKPLGGDRLLATGWKFSFLAARNDSTNYSAIPLNVTSWSPRQNFSIRVLPTLRAAVKLVGLYKQSVDLECAHNGRPPTSQIKWEVAGTYSSYQIHHDGKKLTLYADCWLDWDHWWYQVSVRCRVQDGPFTTYSRWFWAEAKRVDALGGSLFG